jgi:hypothetical protein
MILAALILLATLALVSAILGLFALPHAEPAYMGLSAICSAAVIVLLVVLYAGAAALTP